jgi:hypothetical protein
VPDPFARQLAQALARADLAQSEDGFWRAAGPFAGGLGEGEARRFAVTLRMGLPYRVVGVCDARCGELDLRVLDAYGNVAARALPSSDGSGAALIPQATGVHAVEVRMARCARGPCYFAFNVYAR